MELEGSSCTFLSCFSCLNLGGGGGGVGLMVPGVVEDTIDILTTEAGDVCILLQTPSPKRSAILPRTSARASSWGQRESKKPGQQERVHRMSGVRYRSRPERK